MPYRFLGKSFVEIGIAGKNYVVICVFSIKKKKKNSDSLGLLNDFASSNFDRNHF